MNKNNENNIENRPGWHRHPNGGGWVQDTAAVAESAYVGPSVMVSDRAQVFGSARVSGEAVVCGQAEVYGSARVSGSARVFGEAQIYGEAQVSGWAIVSGAAHVGHGSHSEVVTVQIGRFVATPQCGRVVIGCQDHTVEYWKENWEQIAEENNATDFERSIFEALLEFLCKFAETQGYDEVKKL